MIYPTAPNSTTAAAPKPTSSAPNITKTTAPTIKPTSPSNVTNPRPRVCLPRISIGTIASRPNATKTTVPPIVKPTVALNVTNNSIRPDNMTSLPKEVVPKEDVPLDRRLSGNLRASRSRSLNGWFACGNTHCVVGRATCMVDANDIGTCTCKDGYAGPECQPIDECETEFPCPGGSICVDMFPPAKFKCVCKEGFDPFLPNELSGEPDVPLSYRPISCIDKNECAREENPPCHPDAVCTNTVGGVECVCEEGFIGNGITTCDKPSPETVETGTDAPPDGSCLVSTDCQGSNMQCSDMQCVCLPGDALVGANCQNEVHCDPGGFNNDCHRRATCTEQDGFPGFSCECIDGWEDAYEGANGMSCRDIPPVTEAPPPEPVTEAALLSHGAASGPESLTEATTLSQGVGSSPESVAAEEVPAENAGSSPGIPFGEEVLAEFVGPVTEAAPLSQGAASGPESLTEATTLSQGVGSSSESVTAEEVLAENDGSSPGSPFGEEVLAEFVRPSPNGITVFEQQPQGECLADGAPCAGEEGTPCCGGVCGYIQE